MRAADPSCAVRRQALWFAQRAAEQEKDSVLQQLQKTGLLRGEYQPCPQQTSGLHAPFVAAGLLATSATNSHLPAAVRSEDVLDQLTQRITGEFFSGSGQSRYPIH